MIEKRIVSFIDPGSKLFTMKRKFWFFTPQLRFSIMKIAAYESNKTVFATEYYKGKSSILINKVPA